MILRSPCHAMRDAIKMALSSQDLGLHDLVPDIRVKEVMASYLASITNEGNVRNPHRTRSFANKLRSSTFTRRSLDRLEK